MWTQFLKVVTCFHISYNGSVQVLVEIFNITWKFTYCWNFRWIFQLYMEIFYVKWKYSTKISIIWEIARNIEIFKKYLNRPNIALFIYGFLAVKIWTDSEIWTAAEISLKWISASVKISASVQIWTGIDEMS